VTAADSCKADYVADLHIGGRSIKECDFTAHRHFLYPHTSDNSQNWSPPSWSWRIMSIQRALIQPVWRLILLGRTVDLIIIFESSAFRLDSLSSQ